MKFFQPNFVTKFGIVVILYTAMKGNDKKCICRGIKNVMSAPTVCIALPTYDNAHFMHL